MLAMGPWYSKSVQRLGSGLVMAGSFLDWTDVTDWTDLGLLVSCGFLAHT
jgi:hypothetical protein